MKAAHTHITESKAYQDNLAKHKTLMSSLTDMLLGPRINTRKEKHALPADQLEFTKGTRMFSVI